MCDAYPRSSDIYLCRYCCIAFPRTSANVQRHPGTQALAIPNTVGARLSQAPGSKAWNTLHQTVHKWGGQRNAVAQECRMNESLPVSDPKDYMYILLVYMSRNLGPNVADCAAAARYRASSMRICNHNHNHNHG